ncbi:MAG: CDP-alcohol phosphatidyltransferase family protein [Gammaproteobacteria bacterium]|nr:MAG: CDP-alcohol phosphatidyltransferase family protein [Gammaproteobacteria bacterium]
MAARPAWIRDWPARHGWCAPAPPAQRPCTVTSPRDEARTTLQPHPTVRHLPNLICLIRLALIWPVVVTLHAGEHVVALGLFVAAAVSDGLDGYLAKRFNWTSELGKILDPTADKLLLVTVFVECAWLGLVPWWLTAAVVARDVLIGLGALTFRLWFGPLRGRPTAISKINTAAQLAYVMLVLLDAAAGVPPREMLDACAVLTLATTVVSGLHYVLTFTRRAWVQPLHSS